MRTQYNMYCIKATKEHMNDVNQLLIKYSLPCIQEDHINNDDLAIVAFDKNQLIGFIWCGLMCNKTVGYIDYFVVDSDYSRKGVGNRLARQLLKVANKKNVSRVKGIIRRSDYHEPSAMNALKMAMNSDHSAYTYVYADVKNSFEEIGDK